MKNRDFVLISILFSAPALSATGKPPFQTLNGGCLTYDCRQMVEIKKSLQNGDQTYAPAWKNLLQKADLALEHKPYSVTDKKLLPASGNKHDYYSFGPYWWPNPDTKDHLPYIRKDGQINPSSKTDDTDSKRLVQFSDDVRTLSLAAFYRSDARYAQKAQRMLDTWFLNKKIRMNPNLNYAQAIPGVVNGRGIGIIDTRVLIDVADSIVLLRHAGFLSDKEVQRYKTWYSTYTTWLLNSANGQEEGNWYNNHGAWYDAQVTAFSLFSGDMAQARRQLDVFKNRHLIAQVNAKGELPAELERTRSFHYTNFALAAYARMGRYGEITGDDVWNYELDGRTMRKAFSVVSQQAGKPASDWPYQDIKYTPEEAIGPLLAAARAWNDEDFRKNAAVLMKTNDADINILTPGSVLVK
ncbi:alginate lyase family protein [Enterobacter chengduensis]|uniref:alginate lyase family protein n=1 Tax=Enterobacter chengduensis TaxID=2494701 RepID=UPI00200615D9|nr:alginate lyase family protein [Enterobacter chengduensis]